MSVSPPASTDRRTFLSATAAAFAGLVASGCTLRPAAAGAVSGSAGALSLGPLKPDPAGLIDLPEGFTYRVLSRLGKPMSDGGTVPDRADGMGCFALPDGRLALVRNHELSANGDAGGTPAHGYARAADGRVLPGGTTTLVLDSRTLKVEREFRSLAGTVRNCSGGVTPWGSWLTCEEPGEAVLRRDRAHGYVFEVPAAAGGLVEAVPLKAMGRFNHEAACVDPGTGIVYMTEDRDDGLLYRFVPAVPGKLAQGGRLQALALVDGVRDSRNWAGVTMTRREPLAARWIDLDDVESPADDLRLRGAAGGALLVARGEGMHWGTGELYLCATNGGAARLGQIFRLRPGSRESEPDRLDLFFESTAPDQFNYGDNLTVAPNGHLVVCEDQYTDVVDNHLRGITPDGRSYPIGRLRLQTELAGACFSPDGRWLFVNAYAPTTTLAITGPWATA